MQGMTMNEWGVECSEGAHSWINSETGERMTMNDNGALFPAAQWEALKGVSNGAR